MTLQTDVRTDRRGALQYPRFSKKKRGLVKKELFQTEIFSTRVPFMTKQKYT